MQPLIVVISALLAATAALECKDASDCPAYHWCAVAWCDGRRCGGTCYSNYDTPISPGTDCQLVANQQRESADAICRRAEVVETEPLYGMDESTATAQCRRLPGGGDASRCVKAYFLPCMSEDDCPDNFRCELQQFKDSAEKVCQPNRPAWNNGDATPCAKISDCRYESSPGYQRWEKCEWGYCDRLFLW